ncbi:DUF294 nucleotidyltransferase-like domain-containing protein [Ramlibacter tataouinensis]|uniref:DUF294 nucleotidyltransferase-like domain-containing protein n=1 Tax=Ramlibacter tataouinensis TaxID=94132 RepID=UPI0022F3DCC1|nr:DUF294 nucleotidyltransferase-like domain-containing protein [Ramlibacter tataouinensis]WBY01694.1 DUF294 nucleotidyltransferase-like domain-containing protein [Ramlibacter tataouinensis]
MTDLHPTATLTPSAGLLSVLRKELAGHPPFAQMAPADIDFFVARSEQRYYAPGEAVQAPALGPVQSVFFIRQGSVTGRKGVAELSGGAIHYEPGDLFPLAAAVAQRPVTATYESAADTFVLALPVASMQELAERSAPFADFLNSRIGRYLEVSRRAMRDLHASEVLSGQSLETVLGELARQPLVSCASGATLREALSEMDRRRIGSIVVTGPDGAAEGILTRHDVLAKVALAEVPLDQPVSAVMTSPVHTLTVEHNAEDAALLMSRHGIRHVPVTRAGQVVGVVSERDLFALQRLSLKHVGTSIRLAADVPALQDAAADVRRLARSLLGQGVQARQLTGLISHLNDLLTRRILEIKAAAHGVSLDQACWLALGSEGRSEQTVATDQDNALILPDGAGPDLRRQLVRFALDVNATLDTCGYPLCRGGIMAGSPACSLTLAEWRERFSHWIEHGSPQDLLDASIFFDLRGLAGNLSLAQRLRTEVLGRAQANPRFLKQLALNALSREPPLNWLGGIETNEVGSIDLKLQGAALFVDAARLYSLAHGLDLTGTRERLQAVGERIGLPAAETGAWIAGFEFLQTLRLRVQLGEAGPAAEPNRVRVQDLHDIDRRILKESLRMARRLQQRMRLDYER